MAGSTPRVSREKEERTAIPGIGGLQEFQHNNKAERAQGVNQARLAFPVSRERLVPKEKGVKVSHQATRGNLETMVPQGDLAVSVE